MPGLPGDIDHAAPFMDQQRDGSCGAGCMGGRSQCPRRGGRHRAVPLADAKVIRRLAARAIPRGVVDPATVAADTGQEPSQGEPISGAASAAPAFAPLRSARREALLLSAEKEDGADLSRHWTEQLALPAPHPTHSPLAHRASLLDRLLRAVLTSRLSVSYMPTP